MSKAQLMPRNPSFRSAVAVSLRRAGRGAVFQFHDDPLQSGQRLRDVNKIEDDRLIGTEQLTGGDAEQNGIADGPRGAGDGDRQWCFIHNQGTNDAPAHGRGKRKQTKAPDGGS